MSTSTEVHRPEPVQSKRWADQLRDQLGVVVYDASFLVRGPVTVFLYRDKTDRRLGLLWPGEKDELADAFVGDISQITFEGHSLKLKSCPTDAANADKLRQYFPFTRPTMVGEAKSFGCGDRLGISTAGHIQAANRHPAMRVVLAQQSIREMTRTARTAQQVMDDACWGVFQAGYEGSFGADADHLKTIEDIENCVEAGFLMFTIDPGDHVDDHADTDDLEALKGKFDQLPWSDLECTSDGTISKYEGVVSLPAESLQFNAEQVIRAAVKYGRAIAHTVSMNRRLVELKGANGFELEVSVDETATPTSPQEHYYIASELKRLGVNWLSLAPRFVGDFEKGVDYIGDLDEFRDTFTQHVAIAKLLGPYKISVHSGSDKFSIYPIMAELAGELIHVKTAGTSYLEALRVLSQLETGLFREILDFARGRYEADRTSYHVSADLTKVPAGDRLSDHELSRLLDEFDARQVLHVTFGSVMTEQGADGQPRFRNRIMAALCEHEEAYYQCLERHIGKHMELLS